MELSLVFERKENRGMLNEKNKAYYFENTNRELTKQEMRLLPYMVYTFQNKEKLSNLNEEEINILKSLNEQGLIEFKRSYHLSGYYDIKINEDFYFICNEVLYMSYACKAVGDFEKNIYSNRYIKDEYLSKNKPLLLKLKTAFQDSGVLRAVNHRMKKNLTKKDFSVIENFKKAGFITFEEIEEGKFQLGTTKRFWNQINNVLYPENVEEISNSEMAY